MPQASGNWEARARAGFDAFNRGDLPEFLAIFHRDAILQEHSDFSPNPGTYRGWLEIASYWESFSRVWGDARLELQELRTVDDKVVAVVRFTARGKTSQVPIEVPVVAIGTFEAEKLVRLDLHLDREKALESVGLREGAADASH